MRSFIVLLLLLPCFIVESKDAPQGLKKVVMSIEYVDAEGNQIDKSELPKELILQFPYITGSSFAK